MILTAARRRAGAKSQKPRAMWAPCGADFGGFRQPFSELTGKSETGRPGAHRLKGADVQCDKTSPFWVPKGRGTEDGLDGRSRIGRQSKSNLIKPNQSGSEAEFGAGWMIWIMRDGGNGRGVRRDGLKSCRIKVNQSKSKWGGLAAPTLPPPAPAFRKRLAQTTSATAAALSDAAASALRARFRETCRSAPVSKNASERREIQRRSDLIRVNPTFATHMKSMTYVLARF